MFGLGIAIGVTLADLWRAHSVDVRTYFTIHEEGRDDRPQFVTGIAARAKQGGRVLGIDIWKEHRGRR